MEQDEDYGGHKKKSIRKWRKIKCKEETCESIKWRNKNRINRGKIYFSSPSPNFACVCVCSKLETFPFQVSRKLSLCFWWLFHGRGGDPQNVVEMKIEKKDWTFQNFMGLVYVKLNLKVGWAGLNMRCEWVGMLLTCWIIYTTTWDFRLTLVWFCTHIQSNCWEFSNQNTANSCQVLK